MFKNCASAESILSSLYSKITSLNVGSLSSSFLCRFFNTDIVVGMSLRSVLLSIFDTFFLPLFLPTAAADSSPSPEDLPNPNTFLNAFPTGLFSAYSNNKSIFSDTNKSLCVLTVTPLLNSKTRSENFGNPTFNSGFFFKNARNKLAS